MAANLKDVFFQVYNLGLNKGNFQEYWEIWDGSEELMDSIHQYSMKHEYGEPTTQINTKEIVQEVQPWNNNNPW